MSRNVTILVIILVIFLIAGYLLWLRGRFQVPQPATVVVTPTIVVTPTVQPTIASPSVTATPSGVKKSPTPTKVSTSSGKTVK